MADQTNEQPDYRFITATAADRERIFTFMQTFFYKFEPLSSSLGLTEGPTNKQNIFSLSSLDEGTSLLAVETSADGEERIVGICLNGENKESEEDLIEDILKSCSCPQYYKLLKFLALVEEGGHVWKHTGVDRVLDIHAIAVDTTKRRGGLGKAMVEHTYKLAKELGYPALSMHCTSHYSASLAQKLGMKCVFEINYDEYLDDNGCPVFKPPLPHVALRLFVQMLK